MILFFIFKDFNVKNILEEIEEKYFSPCA